jgi:hypothetical protein
MFGSYPYPGNIIENNTIEFINDYVKPGKPPKFDPDVKDGNAITRTEWLDLAQQVWFMYPEDVKREGDHPAPFPEKLPARLMRLTAPSRIFLERWFSIHSWVPVLLAPSPRAWDAGSSASTSIPGMASSPKNEFATRPVLSPYCWLAGQNILVRMNFWKSLRLKPAPMARQQKQNTSEKPTDANCELRRTSSSLSSSTRNGQGEGCPS